MRKTPQGSRRGRDRRRVFEGAGKEKGQTMTLAECINILLTMEEYFLDDLTHEEQIALNMAIEIMVRLDREGLEV